MAAEPTYIEALGEEKHKMDKRMVDARGYEAIHTEVHLCNFFKIRYVNKFAAYP